MCVNLTFHPLVYDTITGKKRIVFNLFYDLYEYDQMKNLSHEAFIAVSHNKKLFHIDKTERFIKLVQVPCGYCSECLNQKAKSTTFRIMKELQEHESSWFITLTYDEENLPGNYSLVKDEISKFNKKLKVYLKRRGLKSDFRFYGVGEYGGETARPHYHIIYFGLELDDLTFYKKNEKGDIYFNSKFLESVWAKGFVVITDVTVRSAAYVARYTEKKQLQTKEEKEKLEKLGLVPEYSRQSMNPGIGANYLKNIVVSIQNGCYNETIKDSSFSFPKYYMDKVKKLMEYDPMLLAYEEHNKMLANNRYSSIMLAYGPNYAEILRHEEKDKLKNKRKRGN